MKEKPTILIIDDEQTIINSLEAALDDYGYNVVSAKSGEDGIQIYNTLWEEIDLIILDLKMPGMDGYQVLDKIMKINVNALVIVSSGAHVDSFDVLKTFGASGGLAKPYDLDEMNDLIKKILKK